MEVSPAKPSLSCSALTAYLRAAYIHACAVDVCVLKPGNVRIASPSAGLSAQDFVLSAELSAAPLLECEHRLGKRIYQAVFQVQHGGILTNTNLGIILLCAPILQTAQDFDGKQRFRNALTSVLEATNIEDCKWVYRAIRLSNAGNLGEVEEQDIIRDPTVTLLEAMRLAARRDAIALQYISGFRDIFEHFVPFLLELEKQKEDNAAAVEALYMYALAFRCDSLVRRKHGDTVAWAVREIARRFLSYHTSECLCSYRFREYMQAFDVVLKSARLNPGTTADLVVACLLVKAIEGCFDSL